jgi:hypothetical protein
MYDIDDINDRALTADISPDGLRSRRDIKILICYLLASFEEPLNRSELIKTIQNDALANYFEICAAIAALIEDGNVTADADDVLSVTDVGREIGRELYSALPPSVRDKALAAGMKIISRRNNERCHRVEFIPQSNGILVKCDMMEKDLVLLSTCLHVPNEQFAKLVRDRFYDDPESLYRLVLMQLADIEPFS